MCTSMIEVLLGVGLSAMVSPAASDGQPYAHAHVLKVQSSFDRLRSKVRVSRSAHNVVRMFLVLFVRGRGAGV